MAPSASHMLCCRRWTRLLGAVLGQPGPAGQSRCRRRRHRPALGLVPPRRRRRRPSPGSAASVRLASPRPSPPPPAPPPCAPNAGAPAAPGRSARCGPRPPRASGLAPPPRRSGRPHLAARLPWVRTVLSSRLPLPPRTGWSRDPRPDASVLAALQGSRSKQPRFYLSAPSRALDTFGRPSGAGAQDGHDPLLTRGRSLQPCCPPAWPSLELYCHGHSCFSA